MERHLESLKQKGWCEILLNSSSDNDLLNVAKYFGSTIAHPNGKMIDELRPKQKGETTKNTFSHNYELNAFPMHTDTAFWSIPTRYVLLANKNNSQSSTTIVKLSDILELCSANEFNTLRKAIFLLSTQTTSFYTGLINNSGDNMFFRHDPNCMKPMNKCAIDACEILNVKYQSIPINKITWDCKKILIFDNWHTVHGREAVGKEKNRLLYRIYIN